MPTADAQPEAWFNAAATAMRQRRRRSFVGEGGSGIVAADTSIVPAVGPGGGGGIGPGGGGSTTATSAAFPMLDYSINQRPGSAGGTTASATASNATTANATASNATIAAATATHVSIAPLNGLPPKRGWVILAALAALAWYAFGGADVQADGNAARVTIAPSGFAWASFPESLAIATGATSGAIAQDGRAFAATAGSTATAYSPARAAGVPGSVLMFVGTRPDGSRVGVVLRPSSSSTSAYRPWHWYTMDKGVLQYVGAVTDAEKVTITNAQRGILP